MDVEVLGPMASEGEALSPRERSVLSALIVRAGSAVTADELADAYWGADPPPTWTQQIKTSVARIRKRLGAHAVRTVHGGYALGLDPDVVDAVRFERLVSSARAHRLREDPERAVDAYRRALALWRGAAYPDLGGWEPGVTEAFRLDEMRKTAEEELLDARLALGEHRAVIADAERLVRDDPLREERWAILALAAYRSDRQADALATIRAARTRLRDELGIEPGSRLSTLEGAILRQDPALAAPEAMRAASSECPYRGLDAFGVEDAATFFGRDADVERILERLLPGSFVALAGASGCGKSSLALAGVVPRLRERDLAVDLLSAGRFDDLPTVRERSVVVIDQFEELFLQADSYVAARASALRSLVERGGTVLVTVRSDFLDRCVAQPDLAALVAGGVEPVLPLSREQLRAAVEGPAAAFGLRVEAGLGELILRDTADHPTALPMLSHALLETWRRREGTVLTVDGYLAAGGIAGAIAHSAEELYRELDDDEQHQLRALMLRLVERLPDGTTIRRRAPLQPLVADAHRARLINRLVSSRLVSVEGDTASITHEAIAVAWPRLDQWLREDAQDAGMIAALSIAAGAWAAGGRAEEDLLRGTRLQTTLDWREASHPDLTPEETAFLDDAEALANRELQTQRQRAASERRQNRRLRWALAASAALLVAALAAGSVAVVRGRDAAASADDALLEAVTSRAVSLRDTDRDVAALMAVEAYRRWPEDVRTRAALMSSMTEANGYVATVPIAGVEQRIGMWPLPGTDTLFAVRDQTHVELVDGKTGRQIRTLAVPLANPGTITRPWVRVSADGSTGLIVQHWGRDSGEAADVAEVVTFVDLATGTPVGPAVRVPGDAESVSLSDDGRYASWASQGRVVVVGRDGRVGTRDGSQVVDALDVGMGVAVSAFAPDGSLVVSYLDGTLERLNPATLRVESTAALPPGHGSIGLVVAEDGTLFMTGPDGTLAAAPDGSVLWQRAAALARECSRIAASSRSDVAVCGNETGSIQRWRLSSGEQVAPVFSYQNGGAGDLAFIDDGAEVLLLSSSAPVLGKLRVDGSGSVADLFARGMRATVFAPTPLSPSGRYLMVEPEAQISNGVDGPRTVYLWDIAADREVFRFPDGVTTPVTGELADPRWLTDHTVVAFAVTKTRGATGDANETWSPLVVDVKSGEVVHTLPADVEEVFPSARPHTAYAYTAGGDLRQLDTESYALGDVVARPADFPQSVTDTPDGSRVLVTSQTGDARGWTSELFDGASGRRLASGLDGLWSTVMTSQHVVFAGGNGGLGRYSADDLSSIGPVPSIGSVIGLTATSDGATLLAMSGSTPGVAVVDAASGRQLGDVVAKDWVGQVALQPDGSGFIVPETAGLVAWSLDPAGQVAAACAIAGRDLTEAEWEAYLGDLGPWHDTCGRGGDAAASR